MGDEQIYIVAVSYTEGYGKSIEPDLFPFRNRKDAEAKAVDLANCWGHEIDSFADIDTVRRESDGWRVVNIYKEVLL